MQVVVVSIGSQSTLESLPSPICLLERWTYGVTDLAQRRLESGGPALSTHQERQRELSTGAGAFRGRNPDPSIVGI